MGNRTAKFISALFASVLAGAPLSAVSQTTPSAPAATTAADDCLASPKKTAPEGQHWYYRLERGTKRQCWYLRAEGAKTAQTAQATAPSQKDDAPASRSVQDARAEWPSPQGASSQDTTASIAMPKAAASQPATSQRSSATPDSSAEQPAVSARWPDPSAVAAPAAPATKLADARPAPKATAAPAAAPVTLAAAEAPADKPTGSLQTLLLVIGGALALAGILGSAIYRFGGSRVRVQARNGTRRRVNWDNFEPPADNARAPWAEAVATAAPRPQQPRQQQPQPEPLDFSFALPPQQPQQTRDAALADDIQILNELEAAPVELSESAPQAPEIEAVEARAEETHEIEDAEAEADDDAVDIDVITEILERLAKEGPRLSEPSLEPRLEPRPAPNLAADFGDFARSRQARSGARA